MNTRDGVNQYRPGSSSGVHKALEAMTAVNMFYFSLQRDSQTSGCFCPRQAASSQSPSPTAVPVAPAPMARSDANGAVAAAHTAQTTTPLQGTPGWDGMEMGLFN